MSCPEAFVISIVVNTCKTPKQQLIYSCSVFSSMSLLLSSCKVTTLDFSELLQWRVSCSAQLTHFLLHVNILWLEIKQILNISHAIQCSILSLHLSKKTPGFKWSCPLLTSPQVGWIPIVSSSNSLVRPHFIAAAKPWVTSPALGPRTWNPITRFFKTGEKKQELVLGKVYQKL